MPLEEKLVARKVNAMRMVVIKHSGSFKKTTKFLDFVFDGKYITNKLNIYGEKGIEALKNATPVDTGKSAASWDYKIDRNKYSTKITWTNDNMGGSVPVVILLQYGHATKNGKFIKGIDFINPAMKPIFEEIADDIWREVTSA